MQLERALNSMLRQVGRFGYFKIGAQLFRFLWDDWTCALLLCLVTLKLNKEISTSIGPELLLPILGIAISVFTSFRNSQAYARWWEARTLWGGLVNQSRNLRDSLYALLGNGENAEVLTRSLLERHVLLIWTLNNELRDKPHSYTTMAVTQLSSERARPDSGSQELFIEQSLAIQRLVEMGRITDVSRLQLMRVQDEISNAVGGLERIRNQPLPASYDAFIRLSIWVFGFLLYVRLDAVYEPYGAIAGFVTMAGFILAERLGAYIENPFSEPTFALPMNRMSSTITKGLLGHTHPLAVPPESDRATVWT